MVGSWTPFEFYKDTTMGRGVGGTLNTRAGCGRYLTETSRWGGSNIAVQTLLQTGCLLEQPRHLWRIRFQSNRFGCKKSVANFFHLRPKIDRENKGAKVQLLEVFPTLKKLHLCTLQNSAMYRGSVSTFVDLSVTTGAASCHVQWVRFWHLKSADFLETWWGPPLFEARVANSYLLLCVNADVSG